MDIHLLLMFPSHCCFAFHQDGEQRLKENPKATLPTDQSFPCCQSPACARRTLNVPGTRVFLVSVIQLLLCWLRQEEEVQVRKVRALFGVILRTGMERSAGEGLSTCGKGISVNARLSLPARGLKLCACGERGEGGGSCTARSELSPRAHR